MPDHKAIVGAWIAAINAHDPDAIERCLHDDFVWELGMATTTGAAASAEGWRLWFAAFPDFQFDLLNQFAGDGLVCSQLRMTGTHLGEFRFRGTNSLAHGLPPTAKQFDLPGCAVQRVEGDRIRRLWAYWDTATLLRQLGIGG